MIDHIGHGDGPHVVAVEGLAKVINRRDGNMPAQERDPISGGLCAEQRIEGFRQVGQILASGRDTRKARVSQKVWATCLGAEYLPELWGLTHQHQPAILGLKGLAGRDGGMRAAPQATHLHAFIQIPSGGIGELMQSGIKQSDIHVTALPRSVRAENAGEQANS